MAAPYPDIHGWIKSLPPMTRWKENPTSLCIYSSCLSNPNLKLSVAKNLQSSTSISLSIIAEFNLSISLWSSKPIKIKPNSMSFSNSNSNSNSNFNPRLLLIDDEAIFALLVNFVEDVVTYGSNSMTIKKSNSYNQYSIRSTLPKLLNNSTLPNNNNIMGVFNLSFLTLSLLVCIYEAPRDLQSECLTTLKNQLSNCRELRESFMILMRILGSNLEEQWMRSVNLAITNWIAELQLLAASNYSNLRTPSPLFSYSFSTPGLWKVQLYCPVIAMDVENSSNLPSSPERLLFSLNYHQLEGVIQFNHKVVIQDNWVDVIVNTDNIRCDVIRLVNETLMKERGVGTEEKHFPSRISLSLTPILQTNIISLSVSKSSENPSREIGTEKSIEASIDPPNTFFGLKLAAGEIVSMNFKPWKFEESVYGYTAILNWFLHDTTGGKEVFSTKPSTMSLINPKSWFKDRYSSAYRPFTRQGGVIFDGDQEYGKSVRWKVDKSNRGKTMEWEIKGCIYLTYWPNKHTTLFSETRRLQFGEVLHLTIP